MTSAATLADGETTTIPAGIRLADGSQLAVRVRRRGRRYDIDDLGAAVRAAGRPAGWRPVAERVVERDGMNVNRAGVVFVPAVEDRDIEALAARLADCAAAVHSELLEAGALTRAPRG